MFINTYKRPVKASWWSRRTSSSTKLLEKAKWMWNHLELPLLVHIAIHQYFVNCVILDNEAPTLPFMLTPLCVTLATTIYLSLFRVKLLKWNIAYVKSFDFSSLKCFFYSLIETCTHCNNLFVLLHCF